MLKRPTSPRLERWGLVALVVGLPAAFSFAVFGAEPAAAPIVSAVLIGGGLLFALVAVRGVGRLILLGLLAGAVAGLIAGGIGGRIAMRLVSMMGGRREVTLGGTISLLSFMMVPAAVFGVVLSALRRLVHLPSWGVGVVVLIVPGLPLLVGDRIARAELMHEGQVWFNLPVFFALVFAYGFLAQGAMKWLDSRLPNPLIRRGRLQRGTGSKSQSPSRSGTAGRNGIGSRGG
jgi:hypothetical protein